MLGVAGVAAVAAVVASVGGSSGDDGGGAVTGVHDRQALMHASFHVERKLEILWVDAEDLDAESMKTSALVRIRTCSC